MNTRRGRIILFGSLGFWAAAVYCLRAWLPDTEIATFAVFCCAMICLVVFGYGDETERTWAEVAALGCVCVLYWVWIMWAPNLPLLRLKGAMPWNLENDKTIGALLTFGFMGWTVLAHFVFRDFEQRYWRTLGAIMSGMTAADAFVPGGYQFAAPIGFVVLLLGLAGHYGPEFPQFVQNMLRGGNRRSDVFGRARFEDDRRAAEKGGLE